jgi:ribosomal-protein-alanine acetyltransferase
MTPAFEPMTSADLDDVSVIERAVYSHPWTHGNFADALRAGYDAWMVRDSQRQLLGYCITMTMPDEVHLLNISVAPHAQGTGVGRALLAWAEEQALASARDAVLLEVRVSNQLALSFYERHGYVRVGVRRGYYPAVRGREDALVMRKPLIGTPAAQERAHG